MKKLLCASIISTLAFVGCSDSVTSSEESFGVSNAKTEFQTEENFGVNVLTSPIVSDPENDPYTVENMSKAMRKQLLAKSADPQEVEQMTLEPNYLYVRFLAEGKEGVAQLKAYDTSLVLFKHPLDYKPIRKPVVYKDPSLPDNVIPMFATVPVDYDFGPTKYEVIKELFLVEPLDGDDDEADSTTAAKSLLKKASGASSASVLEKMDAMGVSLHDVEWESLNMTGNLGDRVDQADSEIGNKQTMAWSLFGGGKKLGGHLTFQDDYLGEQPLVGVRVTGGYSYYWREAHTDKNGKFKLPEKWTFKIDYEANFDAEDFLLEDGHSWYGEDLEIEHNNYKSDWNEKFTGDKAKWCVVWTAAYQYWYGDNFGLKRPRQNTATNWSLDIEVYYKNEKDYKNNVYSSGSSIGNYDGTLGLEDICILAYKQNSKTIYSTTIHEVAHSSHYWNTSKSLMTFFKLPYGFRNTYTRGVENYFTTKRYGSPAHTNFNKDYTGIFDDLMDNDKNYKAKNGVVASGDAVQGFKITELEKSVFGSSDLDGMKKYLKKNYPSGSNGRKYTESALNNLFNYWTK